MKDKNDFFISYTGIDRTWAEWIAWQLEEADYSTVLQAWDFRPGNDFAIEMQKASVMAERTIAVLSEDYLNALFTQPEWSAAFTSDPTGEQRRLIGVKVRECRAEGMLKSRVYIDLVKVTDREAAKKELLDGVKEGRAKPFDPPHYPGEKTHQAEPDFPGQQVQGTLASATNKFMPKLPVEKTDLAVNDFLLNAFKMINRYFKEACDELSQRSSTIEVRFQQITDQKMVCDVYLGGKQETSCKVWLGRESYSRFAQIGFNNSGFSIDQDTSYNEILNISDNPHRLSLQATMHSIAFGNDIPNFDYNDLSPEQAAEYIWRRFISVLEYRVR